MICLVDVELLPVVDVEHFPDYLLHRGGPDNATSGLQDDQMR